MTTTIPEERLAHVRKLMEGLHVFVGEVSQAADVVCVAPSWREVGQNCEHEALDGASVDFNVKQATVRSDGTVFSPLVESDLVFGFEEDVTWGEVRAVLLERHAAANAAKETAP